MNQKVLDTLLKLKDDWTITPIQSKEDICAVVALYQMFSEYSGHIDDWKISLQCERMHSHRYRFYLLKRKNENYCASGYYTADLGNPKYLGAIVLDQIFIHPEYRGDGLGTFLAAHFMSVVGEIYWEACTSAKPKPKQIIAEHFREQTTQDPISLASMKKTLHNLGFSNLPQKDKAACPKTYLPLDDSILAYHTLTFE